MVQRVMIVHAHAGDESVLTGATIAHLVAEGSAVTVVTATADRPDELSAALRELGVTDHRFLGEPGARWKGLEPRSYSASPETHTAGTLVTAELSEVASDIGAVILDMHPDVLVTVDAGVNPDRDRVHEACRWAAEVLQVPLYVVTDQREPADVFVDDEPARERKQAAAAHYGTAVDAPESLARRRLDSSPQARPGIVTRVFTSVLAVILGVFAGGVLTVIHQSSTTIQGVTVPWGLIVSLVLTAALIGGLRLVYRTRVIPGLASLGLLGASALLSLQSAGGSIVVPDNTAGVTWTIGSVIIVAIVLAWPQTTRPTEARIKAPAAKGPDFP